MTQAVAFKMYLNPGAAAEYKRRHDEIWPEIVALLSTNGISDYRIYFDEETGTLFATQRRAEPFDEASISSAPAMHRWWSYMRDLMRADEHGVPVAKMLPCMFELP